MTVPETVAPLDGAVIDTEGGVVSGTLPDAVKVEMGEVARFPAASRDLTR